MMDIGYYRQRAEEEREAARRSLCPEAARAHAALASAYAARIEVLCEIAEERVRLATVTGVAAPGDVPGDLPRT